MHLLYTLADPRTGFVRYVGKTSRGDLGRRRREHLQPSSLRHKTHKNHWLRELLAEGVEPVVDLLEAHDTVEALDAAETFFIDYLRYIGCDLTNLAAGGTGLRKGSRMSQETKRKMSEAKIGVPRPKGAEWRARIAAGLTGKKASDETKRKMSEAQTGHSMSKASRAKLSTSTKGRKKTPEHRAALSRSRGGAPIRDQFGRIYASISVAAQELRLNRGRIKSALNDPHRSCSGFKFVSL